MNQPYYVPLGGWRTPNNTSLKLKGFPPPLNQTLIVDVSSNPIKFRDLYVPIIVYGRISVGSQSFDIADSGYAITDAVVETLHFSDEEYRKNEEESDD